MIGFLRKLNPGKINMLEFFFGILKQKPIIPRWKNYFKLNKYAPKARMVVVNVFEVFLIFEFNFFL